MPVLNLYLFLFATLLVIHGYGQPAFPHFTQVVAENALTQNSVTSILTDAQGYLWVGTFDGLNRYDGYTFKHYRHRENDPGSLTHNQICSLFNASDSTLWVACLNGLSQYHPGTGAFSSYPFPPEFHSRQFEAGLMVGDTLWLAFASLGLLPFDVRTQRYGRISRIPGIWANHAYTYNNLMRFASGQVGWYYGGQLHRFTPATGICTASQTRLREGHANVTLSPTGELFLLTADAFREEYPGKSAVNLPKDRFKQACQDHLGNFWLFGNGLALIRDQTLFPIDLHLRQRSEEVLIGAVYEDAAHTLWVGTDGYGLWKADLSNRKFGLLNNQTLPPGHALPNDYIRCFGQTGDTLWIGTYPEHLHLTDLTSGKAIPHQIEAGFPPNTTINVLKTDSIGHVWIGTSSGLYVYDRGSKRTRRIPGTEYLVTQLCYTSTGDLLVGCRNRLMLIRNAGKTNQQPPQSFTFGAIRALFEDTSHTCWIGDYLSGRVYQYPLGKPFDSLSIWQKYLFLPQSSSYALDIQADLSGKVWLATTAGLLSYDSTTRIFQKFGTGIGFPNDYLYTLLQDKRGRFWISSNAGIFCFDPRTQSVDTYGLADGLQGLEYNSNAALRLTNGAMVFGGINGVNFFHPDSLRPNPHRPEVYLTSLRIHGKPRPVTSSLALSYTEDDVEIDFVGLDYLHPAKNRYRYQLLPLDTGWVDHGTNRTVRFARLPAGTYTFRVQAANSDGLWSEQVAELSFEIAAPFWLRWWFILGEMLLIMGIALGITRLYFLRREEKRQREFEVLLRLQAERNRISRDLHDHLGAQLALIAGEADKRQAQPISEIARDSMHALRDLLWALHEPSAEVFKLLDKIRAFARQLQPIAAAQIHVQTHPSVDGRWKIASPLTLNALRITQEAMRNAVTHAQATRITVTVALHQGGASPQLTITIEDDGQGFDAAAAEKEGHYGLRNMRTRAAESGIGFSLKAEPGKGVTLRLEIELLPKKLFELAKSDRNLGRGRFAS